MSLLDRWCCPAAFHSSKRLTKVAYEVLGATCALSLHSLSFGLPISMKLIWGMVGFL